MRKLLPAIALSAFLAAPVLPLQAAPQAERPKVADDQKENASDRKTAAAIRKAIVNDKTLSTAAKNVKVVVANGMVTLAGAVNSAAESAAIESHATAIAGDGKVTNNLQVKP